MVTKSICGEPIIINNFGIRANKEGIPHDLGPLKLLLINGDKSSLRLLLTLLKVSRTIKGISKPDLKSITDPSISHGEIISTWEILEVVKHFRIKFDIPR